MSISHYFEWSFEFIIAALFDITILAFIIYKFLLMIKGTRAIPLIRGIVVLFLAATITQELGLLAMSWILDQLWAVVFVALAVIFQPELRRALEQIGRKQLIFSNRADLNTGDIVHIIDEITGALVACAKTKTGVLLIIERETGLNDYIETGVRLDSAISQEFLVNVFVPNTPLHDGAAIIRGDRLAAAACFLPLSDNPYLSTTLGTRHRAGIGISEVSDAIALIVSEETGIISLARGGKLMRSLDEKQLRESLSSILNNAGETKFFWQKKGGAQNG